jgi:hypothetical protein
VTINSIDWKAHGLAISYFTGKKRHFLQFIHKWLPLNASHSLKAEGTGRLCPVWVQTDKDHHHLLACNHPTPMTQWHISAITFQNFFRTYCKLIHPILIQLLTMSFTDWCATPKLQQPDFVQPQVL